MNAKKHLIIILMAFTVCSMGLELENQASLKNFLDHKEVCWANGAYLKFEDDQGKPIKPKAVKRRSYKLSPGDPNAIGQMICIQLKAGFQGRSLAQGECNEVVSFVSKQLNLNNVFYSAYLLKCGQFINNLQVPIKSCKDAIGKMNENISRPSKPSLYQVGFEEELGKFFKEHKLGSDNYKKLRLSLEEFKTEIFKDYGLTKQNFFC